MGPEAASRVFGINPDTGSIFPRVSLRDVNQDQWTFTVGVRDKGIPSLSVETPVTANIQRIGKPVFPSTRYDATKNENDPVDEFVIPVSASDPLQSVSVLLLVFPCIYIMNNYLLLIPFPMKLKSFVKLDSEL